MGNLISRILGSLSKKILAVWWRKSNLVSGTEDVVMTTVTYEVSYNQIHEHTPSSPIAPFEGGHFRLKSTLINNCGFYYKSHVFMYIDSLLMINLLLSMFINHFPGHTAINHQVFAVDKIIFRPCEKQAGACNVLRFTHSL